MITLDPIGYVVSEMKDPSLKATADGLELDERKMLARERRRKIRALVSEIVVHEEHAERLHGLEGFSHILVLYWPHLLDPERRKLTRVHPMGRKDLPEMGIFATCSPARPNPVLVSAVRLLERNGRRLTVQGLEAVDGSPVIDIKMYNRNYMLVDPLVVPEWLVRIQRERDLEEADGAEEEQPFTDVSERPFS